MSPPRGRVVIPRVEGGQPIQFYLQDESADADVSDAWTAEAVDRLVAIAPETVGVGTVRNMTVHVGGSKLRY